MSGEAASVSGSSFLTSFFLLFSGLIFFSLNTRSANNKGMTACKIRIKTERICRSENKRFVYMESVFSLMKNQLRYLKISDKTASEPRKYAGTAIISIPYTKTGTMGKAK